MTADRAQRILLAHGVHATAADAARLLDALVPVARAALRVGSGKGPDAGLCSPSAGRWHAPLLQPVP